MGRKRLMMDGEPYSVYAKSRLRDMLEEILETGRINTVTLTYKGTDRVNVFTLEPEKCDSCGQELP